MLHNCTLLMYIAYAKTLQNTAKSYFDCSVTATCTGHIGISHRSLGLVRCGVAAGQQFVGNGVQPPSNRNPSRNMGKVTYSVYNSVTISPFPGDADNSLDIWLLQVVLLLLLLFQRGASAG